MLTTLIAADLGHRRGRRVRRGARAPRGPPRDRVRRPGQRRRPRPARPRRAGQPGPGLRAVRAPRRTRGPTSCSRRSTSPSRRCGRSRPCPAASAAGSTSRSGWCTRRGCCSSTSRRPGSTRRTGPTCRSRSRRLHAEQGTTIVLTTHYLEEADAIADRVVVIDHGLVIADDTAARLKSGARRPGHPRLRASADGRRAGRRAAPRGPRVPTSTVERTGTTVRIRAPAAATWSRGLVTDLGLAGHPVAPDRGRRADPRRRLPRPDRPQPARDQRPTPAAHRHRRRGSMTHDHSDDDWPPSCTPPARTP